MLLNVVWLMDPDRVYDTRIPYSLTGLGGTHMCGFLSPVSALVSGQGPGHNVVSFFKTKAQCPSIKR